MIRVYTSGCFDLLNLGHIVLLSKAKSLGDYLVVGIQNEEGTKKSKNKYPILSTMERMTQIKALPFVNEVIDYESDHIEAYKKIQPNIVVQGEDFFSGGDRTSAINYLKENSISLILLPRTEGISSTEIKNRIKNEQIFSKISITKAKIIANNFWKNCSKYPEYAADIKLRRFYELKYLIPKLSGDSILDLGCGDGALLNCLIFLTNFKRYYGYDLSANLLENLNPMIERSVYDCYDPVTLPKVDVTIFAGVLPYLFEDDIVIKLFSAMRTNTLFLRTTCTLKQESEFINKFSEELKENYSAIYRPLSQVLNLIQSKFKIESVDRVYPNNIESKFGTKQFYIKAINND